MLGIGIVLLVIGIIGRIFIWIWTICGRIFASVSHITDSTAKAMGWIALNKIVAILSWILLVIGGLLIIGSLLGLE